MKNAWVTMLQKSDQETQKLLSTLKSYGLGPNGHFWTDNLEKMGWMGPRQELIDKNTAVWLIVGSKEDLAAESVRYGLSLLSITVQAQRGHSFPTVILYSGKDAPDAADLPTPLKNCSLLPNSSSAFAAKIVALVNTPPQKIEADYRLDIYGIPGLGEWFEVGPAKETWKGIMFGVSGAGAGINAHGVGAKGKLPTEKMILNYPQEGLKLEIGDKEYTAWAVQNPIDDQSSYFVRALGQPDSIFFGPFASENETEGFVLKLK